MSRQHSIVTHKANYFFRVLEDDYLLMYQQLAGELDTIKAQEQHKLSGSSDCKAMIASILENWMNSKRPNARTDDELGVYYTIDDWIVELRHRYGRNVIIQALKEMEEEGTFVDWEGKYGDEGTAYTGTIIKKPYVQNTFLYRLNLPVTQELLNALPEQSPFERKPHPALGRPKKSSPKVNGLNKNGLNEDFQSLKRDDGSLKEDGSLLYTQINKDLSTDLQGDASASLPASPVNLQEERKKRTDPKLPAMPRSQEHPEHSHKDIPEPYRCYFNGQYHLACPMADTIKTPRITGEQLAARVVAVQQQQGDDTHGYGNDNRHVQPPLRSAHLSGSLGTSNDGSRSVSVHQDNAQGQAVAQQGGTHGERLAPSQQTTSPVLAGDGPAQLPPGRVAPATLSEPGASGAGGKPFVTQPPARPAATQPPLSLREDTPNVALTKAEQKRQIERRKGELWAIIERKRAHPYTDTQRKATCHKTGMEGMLADGVTDAALEAKLDLLSPFQKQTFTVNRLYLEWWPELVAGVAQQNGKKPGTPPTPRPDRPKRRNFSEEYAEELRGVS